MLTLHLRPDVTVLAIELPENDAILKAENDIRIDMGYLIFPVWGEEKKWIEPPGMEGTGIELPGLDYYERQTTGIKLPDGKYELVGLFSSFRDAEEIAVINVAIRYAGGDPNKNYVLLRQMK